MSAKKRRTGALPKRPPQSGSDGYIIERNGQIRAQKRMEEKACRVSAG